METRWGWCINAARRPKQLLCRTARVVANAGLLPLPLMPRVLPPSLRIGCACGVHIVHAMCPPSST